MTHYCDPQGILPLREAIAADMGARRGIDVDARPRRGVSRRQAPDRLLPGGVLQSRRRGDLPEPGLPDLRVVHALPRRVKPVPLHLDEEKGFAFGGRRARAADHAAHEARSSSTSPRTRPAASRRGAARGDRRGDPSQGAARRARLLRRGLRGHPVRRQPASCRSPRSRGWRSGRSSSRAPRRRTRGPAAAIGWAVFPTAEEARSSRT